MSEMFLGERQRDLQKKSPASRRARRGNRGIKSRKGAAKVSFMSDSHTPIADALDKLGTSGEGLTFSAEHTKHDTAIAVEATKVAGNWTFAGAWEYTKKLGNTVLGKVSWRPRANG